MGNTYLVKVWVTQTFEVFVEVYILDAWCDLCRETRGRGFTRNYESTRNSLRV